MINKILSLFVIVALATALSCQDSTITKYRNQYSAVGCNPAGVASYETQDPFLNYFRKSRDWISGTFQVWSDNQPLDLDPNQDIRSLNPGQVARCVMFDGGGVKPVGRFVLGYSGVGSVSLSGGVTVVTSAPGRIVFDRTQTSGNMIVMISSTDPSNYVRGIYVVEESKESLLGSTDWDAQFIENISSMSCLRFMEWARINGSNVVEWSDRPTYSSCRWTTERGVPIEAQIDLCNTIQADMWVCIPHKASDSYVAQMAALIKGRLSTGLKVFVEYSNEVWNNQFPQAQWCEQQGLAMGLSTNGFRARLYFQAKRSVEIFDMFEAEFGGLGRINRVMAAQAGNSWTGEQLMSYNDSFQKVDSISCAPYFGPSVKASNYATIIGLTVEELAEYVMNVELPISRARMDSYAAIASTYGVDMVAYEGGNHVVGVGAYLNDQALTDKLVALSRMPEMYSIYTKYMDDWRASGGKMFCHFRDTSTPSKYGTWGLLEHREQGYAQAYKFVAMEMWIFRNMRWWR